jgi:hypothetical protein
VTDTTTDADEKVQRYILNTYRELHPDHHLSSCDEVQVIHPDAEYGTSGCDTGCEYTRFTATIRCPHERHHDFEYGEFGNLADILAELDREPPAPEPLLPDRALTEHATIHPARVSDGLTQWVARSGRLSAIWLGPSTAQVEVRAFSNSRGGQALELVNVADGEVVATAMQAY